VVVWSVAGCCWCCCGKWQWQAMRYTIDRYSTQRGSHFNSACQCQARMDVDICGWAWVSVAEGRVRAKQMLQWARGQWDYKGGCDADADGDGNGCVGAG
jgi:hypothetical protein